MFEHTTAVGTIANRSRRPWSVALSVAIHTFLILLLLAAPMLVPEAVVGLQNALVPPVPLAAPGQPVVRLAPTPRPAGSKPVSATATGMVAPRSIPRIIDLGPLDEEPPQIGEPGTDGKFSLAQIGRPGGVIGAPWEEHRTFLPPKPSVPVPAAPETTRVEVGGDVQQARLVHRVKPFYPILAIQSRTQGSVVLEAIIDRSGKVENLRVLSGHPLLVPAALEAVRQWRYRPTLLNGVPVEVATQVAVNFNLGGS